MTAVPDLPEECDCPACTGEEFDLDGFLEMVTADATELRTATDPVDAELFGASFIAVGALSGDDFLDRIVPAFAALSTPEALATLLAIATVEAGPTAEVAARQLIEAGVPVPSWAAAIAEPVEARDCRRYADPAGEASILLCTFARAGRSHGFLVHVDHTDCDAAADIMMFPGESLGQVTAMIEADARRVAAPMVVEELEPAEFRWHAERALDAREVHDQESDEMDLDDELEDDNGPGYHTTAVLLAARLRALPAPPRPAAPHGSSAPPVVELKLPAKRKKANGPAPVYRLRVSLHGIEPAIWRSLELPGDAGLAEVHRGIQAAFGWEDAHLHLFQTAYGEFGVPDGELDVRSEARVTLEQVAPTGNEALGYVYDFGDNWELDIVVEQRAERDDRPYPRCVGGEGIAPPEDCGGVWGFADLLEAIKDPGHELYEDGLDAFGVDSAAELAAWRFDPDAVTRALTSDRRRT